MKGLFQLVNDWYDFLTGFKRRPALGQTQHKILLPFTIFRYLSNTAFYSQASWGSLEVKLNMRDKNVEEQKEKEFLAIVIRVDQ